MQSNNPVFRNSDGFKQVNYNAYGNPTYAGNGAGHQGYGQAPTPPPGMEYAAGYAPTKTSSRPMTIDSVVRATGISLGVLIVAAVVTWAVTPNIRVYNPDLGPLVAAMAIGGIGAFALSMVNSFKRIASPALVLVFAALEGVTLGAFSKLVDATYSTSGSGSLVVQAVIGTFAALAGTLAAYKYLNLRVGARTGKVVIALMFGMVGLGIMELILGLFGSSMGLFGFTGLGLVTAFIGLGLGIFMLMMDFQQVENGIANGLPESESWRAAFGLTVSLVWIYQNLLRILAIFANNSR